MKLTENDICTECYDCHDKVFELSLGDCLCEKCLKKAEKIFNDSEKVTPKGEREQLRKT